VINTSGNTLAVKVRFHEQKNSRDVLDFNIVLSPYDSWTGWVEDSAQGTRLRTVDNSCTSPLNVDGVNASNFAYTGSFDDTGGGGLNRLREGYVEMLVMGESDTDPAVAPPRDSNGDPWDSATAIENGESLYVPYHAKHVNGVPRDCTLVDKAFIATAPAWTPTQVTGIGSGNPLAEDDFDAPTSNPLKGNVGWLNAASGLGAGSQAIAVSNWSTENFVTAQQFPWFLEPTFASSAGLWTVTGVTEFEDAVDATATFNEWANNPNNGARSDWVVTFPTKAYHVDLFNEQIQAAFSKYRNSMSPVLASGIDTCDESSAGAADYDRTTCEAADDTVVKPFEEIFGKSVAEDGTGISAITVTWDIYDREENTVTFESSGTSISPAPPPTVEIETLKYEANVVQFADTSTMGAAFPSILDASGALDGANSGWASLEFKGALDLKAPGLPVAAFAIRAIDRTDDAQAYNAGYVLPED